MGIKDVFTTRLILCNGIRFGSKEKKKMAMPVDERTTAVIVRTARRTVEKYRSYLALLLLLRHQLLPNHLKLEDHLGEPSLLLLEIAPGESLLQHRSTIQRLQIVSVFAETDKKISKKKRSPIFNYVTFSPACRTTVTLSLTDT